MTKVEPEVALIVCTRNRAQRLDLFFRSVEKIKSDSPWELILVDSASTDDTGERLRNFAQSFKGRATVIREDRPGLGLARNRGWRESTAPIIAFTDDDCYPEADYLNNVRSVFDDPTLGVVGGRILLYDTSDADVTINESTIERLFHARSLFVCGDLQGANVAFRRKALEDIKGLDDNLGAGTPFPCEDADAVLRVLASGWRGKHDPRPVVYHHHGRKPGPDIDSLRKSYDAGRGAYYAKCMLFLPQRWLCARYWLYTMRRQRAGVTAREVRSALRYLRHIVKCRPNTAY